ncbi:hypothetical protein KP509_05G069600 [Ceratopteris richardii]|uniref:Acyltransferase n=1 Tax=Ceratopteris richardii TaxID=49495 RepID=A0A8T2URZ0_CERRI|nr:hypothetical protein KP509_05G069600 [Ceratopteris richardii]
MTSEMNQHQKLCIVQSQKTSRMKRFLALFLWLSSIHLVLILVFLMLFILPYRWSVTLFVLLVTLMVIPLFERSSLAEGVARFICKHGPGHFPITLVMEDSDALDTERAFIFAVEPHSVLPIGIIGLCHFTGFLPVQKIKAFASSAVFLTPFLRHIWSWLGLLPVSKKVVLEYLNKGYSCILIPGGVREMLYMEHGCEVAYLKKRLGFIRIAIELGVPLVPCFIFGQTRVYNWWKPKGMVYNQVSRALRFAPLVFWGMFGSPIPLPHPLYLVVGKPIELKQNKQPTEEEVLKVQSLFIAAMQELYERHKTVAGYSSVPLYVY